MDFKIFEAYILEFVSRTANNKRLFFGISTINRIAVKINMHIFISYRFQLMFPMDRFFVFS